MTERKITGVIALSARGQLTKSVKGLATGVQLTAGLNVNGVLRVGATGSRATRDLKKYADRQAFFANFVGDAVTVIHTDGRGIITTTEVTMALDALRRLMSSPTIPTELAFGAD